VSGAPTAPDARTRPVRALEEIDEPDVRAALDEYLAHPETIGVLLCGSRVLGWADHDGDYDAFVVVSQERYRSIPPESTLVRLYADGETPRRMIGDFSIFSEEVLEESLRSPLDIDHWPYRDAVVIGDPKGTLEAWRRRLAAYPEERWQERAMNRYIQMAVAVSHATSDDVRGFLPDRQINLARAGLAGIHLWFAIRKCWSPPLKWWTREVERMEIRPDTRAILEGAVLNPSVETVTHLREHMKTELRHAGVTDVEDVIGAFARSFLPERRAGVYRDSYL
jgi:predicted nucleotidyltransferase